MQHRPGQRILPHGEEEKRRRLRECPERVVVVGRRGLSFSGSPPIITRRTGKKEGRGGSAPGDVPKERNGTDTNRKVQEERRKKR